MSKLKWWYSLPVIGAVGAAWVAFRNRNAVSKAVDTAVDVGADMAKNIMKPFAGDAKAVQSKLASLLRQAGKAAIGADGKIGVQTCMAAEWAIQAGVATDEIKALAVSKECGGGRKRAPCGITGPVASDAVKKAILDAGVARGYPRAEVDKAITRESRWHASAVACTGSPPHPVAGGLNQMLASILRINGFDGSPDQFAALTAEEQLPYVLKFINRMPPSTLHLPGDFGLALFWPAAVNKPDSYVIAEPNTEVWRQNPGLRSAGGGPITAGSVRATAR